MSSKLDQRKKEHIQLALNSVLGVNDLDKRFNYEPLFSAHPKDEILEIHFGGKKVSAPLWISSMTGGNKKAQMINIRLAKLAGEFGLGMGLGSCRALLEDKKTLTSFNLRPYLGDALPFYANLGIAQIEKLIKLKASDKIDEMLEKLRADGLIIHINPLQEWLQPEGDRLERTSLEILEEFLEGRKMKVIVKEVGQGMGPQSVRALLKLPLTAIEFAAFGGTNFSKLEILRGPAKNQFYNPLAHVGHSAQEMVDTVALETKALGKKARTREFIISGGVRNFLEGHCLMLKLSPHVKSCLYGQAGEILRHAEKGEKALRDYLEIQLVGLKIARAFLKLRK